MSQPRNPPRNQIDKLQSLRIAAPCETAWETMQGEGPGRFCQRCNKHIHDFAQLTPREIQALLRASRGQLCARLTRDAEGRLVTLPARALPPPANPRRMPQIAAAAVLSLLGLGGAACSDRVTALALETDVGTAGIAPGSEPRAGARPAPDRQQRAGGGRASLSGTIAREGGGAPLAEAKVTLVNLFDGQERTGRTDPAGAFAFPALRPGLYQIRATANSWTAVEPIRVVVAAGEERRLGLEVPAAVWDRIAAGRPFVFNTMGVLMQDAEPLRQLIEESRLVVAATVGRSVPVPGHLESVDEVRTELVVTEVVQGETGERVVQVVHAEHMGLQPGETVLAFLMPRVDDGRGAAGEYVPADFGMGLKQLDEAEIAVYEERIRALTALERGGAAEPAELAEWLVATAEDPASRIEAVRELGSAVRTLAGLDADAGRYVQEIQGAFADFLAAGGIPADDPDPAVLAAFLSEPQKARLTGALLRTERLDGPDLELYEMVRTWSRDEPLAWLLARVAVPAPITWEARRAMRLIADELGDPALVHLLDNTTDDQVRQKFLAALAGRNPS